jgi:hypothetical protein
MIAVALALASCGGGDGPAGPNNQQAGPMSARLDGQAWTAASVATAASTAGQAHAVAGSNTQATIGFGFINAGPGTYPIGAGSATNALVTQGASTWSANQFQGSGTIPITALTAERIAGSFTFTAEPATGGATGTRVVTDGQFDVTF